MKTGRNDPCPCASGKKFKKCCGTVTPVVAPAGSAEAANSGRADAGLADAAPLPAADSVHTWVPLQHQARALRPGAFGRKKPR